MKDKNIFCKAPSSVNIAGKVGVMCFDKTGTLTEEGLDMYGVVPLKHRISKLWTFIIDNFSAENGNEYMMFDRVVDDPFNLNFQSNNRSVNPHFSKDQYTQLLEAIACCHDLTKIKGTLVGKI